MMTPAELISIPPAILDRVYRSVVSAGALAAIFVMLTRRWPSPLDALAAAPVPESLVPWVDWVPSVAAWTEQHADLTAVLGSAFLFVGLAVASTQPVWELPTASRAGSSAALGRTVVVQVGQVGQVAFAAAVALAVVSVFRRIDGRGRDTSELVATAALHLLGAVIWLPGTIAALAFGGSERETGSL